MAALIMYSVIALQPPVVGWLERLKAQRDSRSRGDPDVVMPPSAAKRLAANLPFGKSRKGKGKARDTEETLVPAELKLDGLDAVDVLHTLLLLLLVKKVRAEIEHGDKAPLGGTDRGDKNGCRSDTGGSDYAPATGKTGYNELGGIADLYIGPESTRSSRTTLLDVVEAGASPQDLKRGGDYFGGDVKDTIALEYEDDHAGSDHASLMPPLAPPDLDDDAPPQYSLADPVRVGARPRSKTTAAAHAQSISQPKRSSNRNLWSLYLAQALGRLEIYCLEVLPASSDASAWRLDSSNSSENPGPSGDGARDHPDYLLPPLDVCLAWAAMLAGPENRQPRSPQGMLPKLNGWFLPLATIAALHSKPSGRASRDHKDSWIESTESPFHLSREALFDRKANVLSDGLRICCPSPTCSFAIKIPFLGDAGGQMPTLSFDRGLVEQQWRRKCSRCEQEINLDTLVGRKLLADIQRWCEVPPSSCKDLVFPGLLETIESGTEEEIDDTETARRADVLASQILAPLFPSALSTERRRRNEVNSESKSMHSQNTSTSNGSASELSSTAISTLATSALSLGISMAYSLSAIEKWLLNSVSDTVVDLRPLDGADGLTPGGRSGEESYKAERAGTRLLQLKKERESLVLGVHALLEPYRRLAGEGLPSVEGTVEDFCEGEEEEEWTDVLLRLDRAVDAMTSLAREVEQWRDIITLEEEEDIKTANRNVNSSIKQPLTSQDSSSKGKAKKQKQKTVAAVEPPGISTVILKSYLTTLSELSVSTDGTLFDQSGAGPSNTKAMMPMLMEEAMEVLNGDDTPVEVRVGRLAHELSKTRYEDDMKRCLGVAPRGLLGL